MESADQFLREELDLSVREYTEAELKLIKTAMHKYTKYVLSEVKESTENEIEFIEENLK